MRANNKSVYFRVDYGGLIGRGHLSRCLSVANVFKAHGIDPIFIIRKRPSIAEDRIIHNTIWLTECEDVVSENVETWKHGAIESEYNEVANLIEPNSLIFLDHYALDSKWQNKIQDQGHSLAVFQDYRQQCSADILINYNINAKDLYVDMSAAKTRMLLGTEFAPLNTIFQEQRGKKSVHTSSSVKNVGIYLGAVATGYFEILVQAIVESEYLKDKNIEWITSSDDQVQILKTAKNINLTSIHKTLPSLMPMYLNSDVFIGSCGVSFLERACLGLMQVNFIISDNQIDISEYINKNNLGIILGDIRKMSKSEMTLRLNSELMSLEKLQHTSHKVFDYIDGKGALRIFRECQEMTQ